MSSTSFKYNYIISSWAEGVTVFLMIRVESKENICNAQAGLAFVEEGT